MTRVWCSSITKTAVCDLDCYTTAVITKLVCMTAVIARSSVWVVHTRRRGPVQVRRRRRRPIGLGVVAAFRTARTGRRTVYVFVTALLALLIAGMGAGLAFGCRMEPDEGV